MDSSHRQNTALNGWKADDARAFNPQEDTSGSAHSDVEMSVSGDDDTSEAPEPTKKKQKLLDYHAESAADTSTQRLDTIAVRAYGLSTDVLANILGYLDGPKDIMQKRRVCKKWKEAVKKTIVPTLQLSDTNYTALRSRGFIFFRLAALFAVLLCRLCHSTTTNSSHHLRSSLEAGLYHTRWNQCTLVIVLVRKDNGASSIKSQRSSQEGSQ